VSWSSIHVPTL